MKHCGISFSLLFLMSCTAQQPKVIIKKSENKNTLLWQVSGKNIKQPSFLFGTFHLLCKEDIHFSEPLVTAIKASHEIYMELDMDDPSALFGGLAFINMKDGKNLRELYSASDYIKIERYFKDTLHIPLGMFQKIKPYFLVAMLYPRMMNCSTPSGVEEELIKIAKDNKKEIQGFETVAFQASVFDSIPYAWQAKELMKNIDSFQFYKKQLDTMVMAYSHQQIDQMTAELGKSEFGSNAYEDLLLTNRNLNWLAKLKTIMVGESVFVAVGAGHLLGEKGMIRLLQKEGYNVEPVNNR